MVGYGVQGFGLTGNNSGRGLRLSSGNLPERAFLNWWLHMHEAVSMPNTTQVTNLGVLGVLGVSLDDPCARLKRKNYDALAVGSPWASLWVPQLRTTTI